MSLSDPYAIKRPRGKINKVFSLLRESTISFNNIGTATVANFAMIKNNKANTTLDLNAHIYGNIFEILPKSVLSFSGISVLEVKGILLRPLKY